MLVVCSADNSDKSVHLTTDIQNWRLQECFTLIEDTFLRAVQVVTETKWGAAVESQTTSGSLICRFNVHYSASEHTYTITVGLFFFFNWMPCILAILVIGLHFQITFVPLGCIPPPNKSTYGTSLWKQYSIFFRGHMPHHWINTSLSKFLIIRWCNLSTGICKFPWFFTMPLLCVWSTQPYNCAHRITVTGVSTSDICNITQHGHAGKMAE